MNYFLSFFQSFWRRNMTVLSSLGALICSASVAHAAAPYAQSVSAPNTSPGQTITIEGRATDADGDIVWIHFYVNNPNWNGWEHRGSVYVGYSGDATASVSWTIPSNGPAGTWVAHIRAEDSNGTLDSNGDKWHFFDIKWPQNVWSENRTMTLGQSFSPPYYGGGSGSGAWQFVVGGHTNWGGSEPGTLLWPSNQASTSWTPDLASNEYWFWVRKLGYSRIFMGVRGS